MNDIAAFGIANVDLLFGQMARVPQLGEEIYSKSFSRQLGGGPVATVIHLARLGLPARLATYVGHGDFSCFVREQLSWNHVAYTNLHRGREPEPLTVSSIISCTADRCMVSYRPPEEAFAVDEEELYHFYRESRIAYVPLEHAGLCRRLKKAGCTVVMDSYWDDGLCLDWYRDVFPYVDYFTPNEKEALKITGAASLEAALDTLSEYLPAALIKLGERGCLVKENGTVALVPAVPFPHIDSTGAGDAFLAGLIYGIYRGYGTLDCVRFGNIAGGNAVTRIGCLSAELNEEELLDCYRKYYPAEITEPAARQRKIEV